MKQIRKVLKKTKFDLGKRTGKEPSDATSIAPPASSLSQVDSGSGAIANFKDTVQPDKQSVEDPDRIATVEPISPHLSSQDPQPGCSDVNHRPGYFAGASHVDASHGVFIDVAGDINIISEKQEYELLLLDKLPHVKDAGYQSGNHDRCLDGTRIEELRRIEDWEADDKNKRVYWLNGGAGTGKSTITQTFAERSSANQRLGASFFCSRDFDDRSNIHLIFPTLAFHLAYRYAEFKTTLIQILNSTPNAGHQSLALQLENLLVLPLQSTRLSTTIVIDALDECKDKQPASAILSLLGRHIDAMPFVKFFITGRPEIPIRIGFRLRLLRPHTEVFVLHEVVRASVDEDIKLYIRTRLSEIAAERSRYDVNVVWPTDEEIDAVVAKSSGVFIIASVIIKFVISPHHNPQERLEIITSTPDSTVHEGRSGVDVTYDQIFLQSFADIKTNDTEFFDRLRLIVGSIALVFNPLSCASIAAILGMSPDDVSNTIRSLHSVLMVPVSDSDLLRVFHKSFPDYLTDPTRCTDPRFHVDPSIYHLKLGTCCLTVMNRLLKKNISNLPAYSMNEDIDDLFERRSKYIGIGLEYACKSWARHLVIGSKDGGAIEPVVKSLDIFLRNHLLSWLEVLSVIGELRSAIYSLADVKAWLAAVGLSDTELSAIVNDSERFVLRFFDAIEASAVHIYHSALTWCPRTSLVRRLYRRHIPPNVTLLNSIDNSWDACTRVIQIGLSFSGAAYSHKDDLIAVIEFDCMEVFEVVTGQRRAVMNGTFSHPPTFSSDDTLIVTGCRSGIVQVWDVQTGSLVCALEGHTGRVFSVAFSPCGTMLVSGSSDKTVRIWNVSESSSDCRCILKGHLYPVHTVCWSPAGHEVVSGCRDGSVWVWDVPGMKCSKTLAGHSKVVTCVAYSPDSSWIASGSVDGTVNVYGTGTVDVFQTALTRARAITSIRFSTPERLMYMAKDSTFVIWDVTKQAQVSLFKYDGDEGAISSDGASIVSGSDTLSCIKLWHMDFMSQSSDVVRHSEEVSCVAFSGDGRFIASGSADRTVRLWDANSGLCLHITVRRHTSTVASVTFSPDSRFCASSSYDNTTWIWDVPTLAVISILNLDSNNIIFSPDSSQLLCDSRVYSGDDSPVSIRLLLCEVETGRSLAEMTVTPVADVSLSFVFDIDGTIRKVSAKDDTVDRWQISPASSSTHGSSIDDNEDDHSSLPMVFVPIHDEEQQQPTPSISPAEALPQYKCSRGEGWIKDNQDRQVLWIPPDLRGPSDCYGKKVVIGSDIGKVTIVHFAGDHAGHSI